LAAKLFVLNSERGRELLFYHYRLLTAHCCCIRPPPFHPILGKIRCVCVCV